MFKVFMEYMLVNILINNYYCFGFELFLKKFFCFAKVAD